jgi:anthranilate phosphoribosyltransferase
MKAQLARVLGGDRLGEAEAGEAMGTIMDGAATPAQIGALLAALAVRGETEDEVVGFARVMRARAIRLRSQGAIDTCGTGGDGAGTFNISTLASFVVAACGVSVVKHGNRSSGGSCGSADVLEALGVRLDPGPETVQRSLDEAGWAFLFAPAFHASTRHAAGPRKELGARTAFNLLGPLTNPAFPEAQIVGVPKPELVGFMSRCLRRLGLKRAWVVHGSGLDEIGLSGQTQVVAFDENGDRSFTICPEEAGLSRAPLEALRGGSPHDNAVLARAMLEGALGARRDVVLLNAAAALCLCGRAQDMKDGVKLGAAAIDDGRALRLLERVKEIVKA